MCGRREMAGEPQRLISQDLERALAMALNAERPFTRSDPENFSVNARCLDDFDPAPMRPRRFFDGRNWEDAFIRRTEEATPGCAQ
jgi:hypothetical protein